MATIASNEGNEGNEDNEDNEGNEGNEGNEALNTLCHRALADPSSLSEAEINVILSWVSPEEDDRLCRQKTGGKSRADLIAQALAHPEQLTTVECELLGRFVTLVRPPPPEPETHDPLELIRRIDKHVASYRSLLYMPQTLQEAAQKAVWAAAVGEDERRARTAALGRDPMAGFAGEVTLVLPKVFDFLIFALSGPDSHIGGWKVIYQETEVPRRYTSVFHHNPANSAPAYYYAWKNRDNPEQHP